MQSFCINVEQYAFLFSKQTERFGDFISNFYGINCSDVYDSVFSIYTTEFNQFLDQFIETDGVALNKRYILLYYIVGALVVQQSLTWSANECKRCAELMADIGEETKFFKW